MPLIVAFKWWRFRGRVRALKAQRAGRESPVVPVELRTLPVMMGKAGWGSGKPHEDGVVHNVP